MKLSIRMFYSRNFLVSALSWAFMLQLPAPQMPGNGLPSAAVPKEIVRRCVESDDRTVELARNYTYNQRVVRKHFDSQDGVKSVHIETWEIDIPIPTANPESHKTVTQNFVNAILKNEPLIAPGEEGVRGLEIGNAMLMAGVTRQAVTLPMDAGAFDTLLKDLEKQYGGKKKMAAPVDAVVDMNASFKKA